MHGKTPRTEQTNQPPAPSQQTGEDQLQAMPFAEGLSHFSPRDALQEKLESGPTAEAPPPGKGGDEKDDLGKLDSLGKKFQRGAGKLAEKVAPNPGQTGKMQVFVNIPVAAGGLVNVNLRFSGQVTQTDSGGYTLRAEVGGGVSAGKEIDLYFVTLKAFAAAQVFGYIEASGDSGEEAFKLMCLSIHDRLAKVSKKVANAVFGNESLEDAYDEMDEDDYVEAGVGASAVVGAGASVEGGPSVGGWATAGVTKGEKVSRGEDGEIKKDETKKVTAGLGAWFAPFRLGGNLSGKWVNGAFSEISADLTGAAMMGVGEIEEQILGGTLVPNLASTMAQGIGKQAKILGDRPAIEKAAELAGYVQGKTSLNMAVESGSQRAIESLGAKYVGLKVGMSLTLTATWSKAKGFSFSLKMERQTRVDIGKGMRDPGLFVRLENLQKIFAVES